MAKKQFKSESKRLLELMINSIYTHKEIFLRELISNASDAIDKLYYMALTDENISFNKDDFYIKLSVDKEKRTITLEDTGIGMSEEELISAMQYGSKNPLDKREETDLGRYGLGMKTASLSQCRILTVITKQNGVVSGAQWNLDHVKKAESWSLLVLDDAEFNKYPSYDKLASLENGTLVIWQDLDKFAIGENDIAEAFSRKMALIREHLALVFHRYLSGEQGLKKLDIRMNELSIDPHDPFLSKKSTQLMDEETIVVRGSKVKVKPYILPHV